MPGSAAMLLVRVPAPPATTTAPAPLLPTDLSDPSSDRLAGAEADAAAAAAADGEAAVAASAAAGSDLGAAVCAAWSMAVWDAAYMSWDVSLCWAAAWDGALIPWGVLASKGVAAMSEGGGVGLRA